MKYYYLFTISNGYCGCDEENIETFTEKPDDELLYETLVDLVGLYPFLEDDRYYETDSYGEYIDDCEEEYYQSILDYSSCEELTRKEYEEYCEERGYTPEEP